MFSVTLPGFMIFNGSIAFLTVFMSSTVFSPNSSVKYSFFPRPTPCSPVPLENMSYIAIYLSMANSTYMFHPELLRDEPVDEQHH